MQRDVDALKIGGDFHTIYYFNFFSFLPEAMMSTSASDICILFSLKYISFFFMNQHVLELIFSELFKNV